MSRPGARSHVAHANGGRGVGADGARARGARGGLRSLLARRLVWGVVVASGCVTWRSESVPPPGSSADLGHVLIGKTDGSVIELWNARVAGDSITGQEHVRRDLPLVPVSLPVDIVRSVQHSEISPARTGAAVVGMAALTAVGALVAANGFRQTSHLPPAPTGLARLGAGGL